MFLSNNIISVLVLLCVLALSRCASGAASTALPCNITTANKSSSTPAKVNCTRRGISTITTWAPEIDIIQKDAYVQISFYDNDISEITQLPAVPGARVSINFQENKIADIVDNAFSKIERLSSLDLSHNQLMGNVMKQEIFHGAYKDGKYGDISLDYLILDYNQIHSLDKRLFAHTPNLTRLALNHNPLKMIDEVTALAISSAKKLKYLELAYTDLESLPKEMFIGLQHLEDIDLSGNQFFAVPSSLSLVGGSLKYLTFNDNPIIELNDDSFAGLKELIQLEVANCAHLQEVKRSTFSTQAVLIVLHLCHNPSLRFISHNAFRGLKDKWTLKEVYLDDNNLSELSPDLMPWSKLETLGMTGNYWLCNCDLVNIVSTQKAGEKFNQTIPRCAAPMRLIGANITNVTLSYCPTFDKTFAKKKWFFSDLKPKQILWSIFGVGIIVCAGMLLGLCVNSMKTIYKNNFKNQPNRYVHLIQDP